CSVSRSRLLSGSLRAPTNLGCEPGGCRRPQAWRPWTDFILYGPAAVPSQHVGDAAKARCPPWEDGRPSSRQGAATYRRHREPAQPRTAHPTSSGQFFQSARRAAVACPDFGGPDVHRGAGDIESADALTERRKHASKRVAPLLLFEPGSGGPAAAAPSVRAGLMAESTSAMSPST